MSWTPKPRAPFSAGNPFARRAFPSGVGGASYRASEPQQATGLHVSGAPAAPVGAGPIEQTSGSPPVAWIGAWRPSEAELQRWGGRVVLYGGGVPDHPDDGINERDVLDATLPWPMACDCVFACESLGAVPWATPIEFRVQAGVGRASWVQRVQVQNVATGINSVLQRQPFRQINIRARFLAVPAAGEVIGCSAGFGLVGV